MNSPLPKISKQRLAHFLVDAVERFLLLSRELGWVTWSTPADSRVMTEIHPENSRA